MPRDLFADLPQNQSNNQPKDLFAEHGINLESESNISKDNRSGIRRFLEGIPQGLGNIGVGTTQAITDIVDPKSQSQFSQNLGCEVIKLKQKQSELPLSERAGVFSGEI